MFNKIFRRSSSSAESASSPEVSMETSKEEVIDYIQRSPDWVDVPLEEFCRKPADFPPTPKVVEPQPPKVVEVQPPKTEEQERLDLTRTLIKEAEDIISVEKTKGIIISETEQNIVKLKNLQSSAKGFVKSNRKRSRVAEQELNILVDFDAYSEEEEEEKEETPPTPPSPPSQSQEEPFVVSLPDLWY